MGEWLQGWGLLGALRKRSGAPGVARSTPATPPTHSHPSSPSHEHIELRQLSFQVCFLYFQCLCYISCHFVLDSFAKGRCDRDCFSNLDIHFMKFSGVHMDSFVPRYGVLLRNTLINIVLLCMSLLE